MKQLLIVNSAKALNAKANVSGDTPTPYDLSNLAEGAISFYELDGSSMLSAAATKNFAIALGRGTDKPAFVIPEVDIETLEIVKAVPKLGNAYSAQITFPTPVVGKEYTLLFIKKGVVPHERNTWSVTIVAGTTTAATEAGKLKTAIENKVNDEFPFTVSASSATLTITCKNVAEQWTVKAADSLTGVGITETAATPTIGDKAFILDLAQRCAAGKGFNYLDQESLDIYPGYPEAVEDFTLNTSGSGGVSTTGYALYSLHFATGRVAGKQTDERVWQYVHIAVPITNASYSTIDGILPEGVFKAAASAALTARVKALEEA